MRYERAFVLVIVVCLFSLLWETGAIGRIYKSQALKATPLRNRTHQVQKPVKEPSHARTLRRQAIKVPLVLKTKLRICNTKLTAIEKTLKEIRSVKVLQESHANSLKEDLPAFASSLKEAFDKMIEEVKKGNPRALLHFESMAKSYEKRVKSLLTQAQETKELLRKGEIKPEKAWLQKLTPDQRKSYFQELTPEGQRIMEEAYPRLFGAKRSLLEIIFLPKEAEAKAVQPCEAPCGLTAEQAMGMSQEQLEQFWNQASEECKDCVQSEGVVIKVYAAWYEYQSCRREVSSRSLWNPMQLFGAFFDLLRCLYAFVGTVA